MEIHVTDVCKSYGGQAVLDHLNLTLKDGCFYCLTAPSGDGKTTLLRLLMGLEQPDSGVISGVTGRRIAAVFQEDRLLDGYNVLENIRFVTGKRDSDAVLLKTVTRLLPADSLNKPVREFSGGMKRRAAILRAILADSDTVLMDEPFTGLDRDTKLTAIAMIREFCSGKLLIVATHAEEDVELLGAEIISL